MRVVKKIGDHKLEVDFSSWTGHATIEIDGVETFSDWFFNSHKEYINIDGRVFMIRFSGIFIAHVKIKELL